MAKATKKVDLGGGVLVPVEIDTTWDEDTLDAEIEKAILNFGQSAANTKMKQQQMTHEYATPGSMKNFTPEWERAREVGDWDAYKTILGAEMSALGTGSRMLFNKATGDRDEYDVLKKQYESEKEALRPLEETHPGTAFLARSTPYLATSPSAIFGGARGTINAASKILPKSVKIALTNSANTALNSLKAPGTMIGETLAGRGPLSAIANPIKGVNNMMYNATANAPIGSKTQIAMDLMSKPAVQAPVLGGTIGAIHPDDSAAKGAAVAMATAGLARSGSSLLSKSPKYLTKAQKEAVKAADDIGYYLTPGTRTGDPFKGQIDNIFGRDAVSSPIVRDIDMANNTTVSRKIGEYFGLTRDTPVMSIETLDEIKKNLSNRFGMIFSNSNPVLTKPTVGKLDRMVDTEIKWNGGHRKGEIIETIDTIKNLAGVGGKRKWGRLSPADIQDLHELIRTRASAAYLNKSGLSREAKVWKELNKTLDKTLEDGLPAPVRARMANSLKDTRKKYRELSIVTQSTDKNSGVVDLKSLYSNLVGTNTAKNTQFKFLKNEDLLPKLARIGRLQQETKARMDLGTRQSVGATLHEGRPVVNRLVKRSLLGLHAFPSNIIKKSIANTYFNPSGYPAATGMIPLFSHEAAQKFNKLLTRGAMGEMPFDSEPLGKWNLWK